MISPSRMAIESQYIGKCTITEYKPATDPMTKVTKHSPDDVLTDQPCRLSFKNITTTNQTTTAATITQITKLFIAPEIIIKPGSKITVFQNGVTCEYKNSGKPAMYSSHQEVILELFQGWS